MGIPSSPQELDLFELFNTSSISARDMGCSNKFLSKSLSLKSLSEGSFKSQPKKFDNEISEKAGTLNCDLK